MILPADMLLGKDDRDPSMPVAERAKDGSVILCDLFVLDGLPAMGVAEAPDPVDGNDADFSRVGLYRSPEVCSGIMSGGVYQTWLESVMPQGRGRRAPRVPLSMVRYPIYKMPETHRVLGFCRCHHQGMRNILLTNGTVELVGPKEFIARIKSDAQRNGIALNPKDATEIEEQVVSGAIKNLGDDDFDRRENAMQELRELCNVDGPRSNAARRATIWRLHHVANAC